MASSTLLFITDACCSMLQLKQIHAYSITSSFLNNRNVLAGVFRFAALSPFGDAFYAHQMLDQMVSPNGFFYNTLIRGYAKSPFPSYSVMLFNQMRRKGIDPDEFSFNFVIKARSRSSTDEMECDEIHSLVVKLGFTSHLYVQNSLIHWYARRGCPSAARIVFSETVGPDTCSWSGLVSAHIKAGELTMARQVFNAMPHKDVVSWTAMISGYSEVNHSAEALELFNEMVNAGHRPDEITLITVLSACKAAGNVEFGMRLHRFVEENGLGWMVSLCNALIDMYGKCGCVDRAWMVFQTTQRKSLITWNIMISTFAERGDPRDAFWLFDSMLGGGFGPDCFTMLAVLRAHGRRGSVDEGLQVFERMERDFGVKPNEEHFGCVVDMLCQVGRLEEAYEFAVKLPFGNCDGAWRRLLNACRGCGNMNLEEKVVKKLLVLNPGHRTYLALLHDICCIQTNSRD